MTPFSADDFGFAYMAGTSDGWTLQGLMDAGMSVTGGCSIAIHQKLDLEALRDRFGADARLWNAIFNQEKKHPAAFTGQRVSNLATMTGDKGINRQSESQCDSGLYVSRYGPMRAVTGLRSYLAVGCVPELGTNG
ncbi:hypothetical protein [Mesorhizobium sp. AA23]|uniref:hypothetical protein n=1 Tax=Mesorhizobium sp. AA23 TaxID=1854058 RepID=UPI0007FBED99|nr:hypothetical protein [Mesorhizobium sp. AA23]OBQ96261.1 hypothetical protein A9K66_21945 [Mesorhizobium sp. AA23]